MLALNIEPNLTFCHHHNECHIDFKKFRIGELEELNPRPPCYRATGQLLDKLLSQKLKPRATGCHAFAGCDQQTEGSNLN